MANEMGGSPGDTSNDASPFDVALGEPAAGAYLIEVDEIEHEPTPELDEPEVEKPLASDAAAAEAAKATTARRFSGRALFDLPPAGALREVPAYFPPAMIPKGIRFPQGIEAVFVKIPASFTSARHKGDRYLILWGTSEADEKLAAGRAMGDTNRGGSEMAKQLIRAVDGHIADWSGMPTPGSVDSLWREIGPKGRNLMTRMLMKLNVLNEEELVRFFEECVAVVPLG